MQLVVQVQPVFELVGGVLQLSGPVGESPGPRVCPLQPAVLPGGRRRQGDRVAAAAAGGRHQPGAPQRRLHPAPALRSEVAPEEGGADVGRRDRRDRHGRRRRAAQDGAAPLRPGWARRSAADCGEEGRGRGRGGRGGGEECGGGGSAGLDQAVVVPPAPTAVRAVIVSDLDVSAGLRSTGGLGLVAEGRGERQRRSRRRLLRSGSFLWFGGFGKG